jgi:uncharacterized protein YqjF (DUF2071 family)
MPTGVLPRLAPFRLFRGGERAHPSLSETAHRPWPLPAGRWLGRQTWHDLLFAHWPIPEAALRPYVPDELAIQEREGTAWVGVTPFRLTGVTLRGLPALPWVSAFSEVNVRVYVERDGKPGIWFLSLDADQRTAVWTARALLNLPYVRARISISTSEDEYDYQSTRVMGPPARFFARYRPDGAPSQPLPGSLEHFLTERYCLYTRSPRGGLWRMEIHHAPWALQPAHAEVRGAELLAADGIALQAPPALLHFAQRQNVVVWPPERVTGP